MTILALMFKSLVIALLAAVGFVNFTEPGAVYSITQDEQGCIWAGTGNGLARYDGLNFRIWQEGLPDRTVTSLATGPGGILWIGTEKGLCVKDGAGIIPAENCSESICRGHIRALCRDAEGFIWAATKDGTLAKMHYSSHEGIVQDLASEYLIVDFEGDYPYQQIFPDSRGRLWLGGRLVTSQVVRDLQSGKAEKCIGAVNSGSFAELDGSIYTYEDYYNQLCIYEPESDAFRMLGKLPIAHGRLLADSRGRMWVVGSYGLGLLDTQDPSRTQVFKHEANDPASPSSSELNCIFEDRQGNLWLGGDNGLSVLAEANTLIQPIEGIPSKQITALMQGSDGRLWVGTADSGAFAIDGDKITRVDHRPAGRTNEGHVSCLYEDSEGSIYIGLWAGCGFNIYKNGRVSRGFVSGPIPEEQRVVADGDRITSNWISGFLEDSRGRFWVATWEGMGLNEWDRSTRKTLPTYWLSPFKYPTPEKDSSIYLSSRLASCILEDSKGNLVFGTTEAGLNIIDPGTGLVQKYLPDPTDPKAIPHDHVTALALAPDGELTVATRGGVWTPSGKRMLDGRRVESIAFDRKGRLWAGTEEGLCFVDTDGSEGDVDSKLGHPCLLQDGRIAIGGMGGAASFDPDSLLSLADRAQVFLTDYSQEGLSLKFSFSATDLPLAARLHYRYRLDGEDADWINAPYPQLNGRYGRLRPGRYTLRIQCSDPFGRWKDEELTLPMRIHAPLLLRWPFILLYLLAALAAVWLYVHLHERKLQHDKAVLEEAVRQKTAQLQEELETRNRFFSIVSHDLRNPVTGIRNLSQGLYDQVDNLDAADVREGLSTLKDASARTASLLDDLLLWAVSQSGVLQPVLQDYSVSELVSQAVDSVIDRANAKDLEIDFDGPSGLMLRTDKNMLVTVIRNLLDNAVKFSPRGGKIKISACGDGPVKISVQDEGPGLSGKSGGSGLRISRELLDKLGAELLAENPEEGGCKMTILLK